MLSWEEIVNRVTIASNYHAVRTSAVQWEAALRRAAEVRADLHEVSVKSRDVWTGEGAEAFRTHIGRVTAALEKTVESHFRVSLGLTVRANGLAAAVRLIVIPEWMRAEVQQRQLQAQRGGAWSGFAPGAFWASLIASFDGAQVNEEPLRTFYREAEQQAQQAYRTLCEAYGRELEGIPAGTRVAVPTVRKDRTSGTAGTAGATAAQRAAAQQAAAQQAAAQQAAAQQAAAQQAALQQALQQAAAAQPPNVPFEPPNVGTVPNVPGTGLAGVEPNLDGAGLGKLPGIGGPGGGGGFGGGSLPPIGPTVAVPANVMASARQAPDTGKAVQVAAAGSGGAARAMPMGMMPGMMGGGAPGNANQQCAATNTFLHEDGDPFGPDNSVPAGVLDC